MHVELECAQVFSCSQVHNPGCAILIAFNEVILDHFPLQITLKCLSLTSEAPMLH